MDKNEIALQLTLKVLEKTEVYNHSGNSEESATEVGKFTATIFNALLKTLKVEN